MGFSRIHWVDFSEIMEIIIVHNKNSRFIAKIIICSLTAYHLLYYSLRIDLKAYAISYTLLFLYFSFILNFTVLD